MEDIFQNATNVSEACEADSKIEYLEDQLCKTKKKLKKNKKEGKKTKKYKKRIKLLERELEMYKLTYKTHELSKSKNNAWLDLFNKAAPVIISSVIESIAKNRSKPTIYVQGNKNDL